MKAIKIEEKNRAAIEAALKAVNGTAVSHTYTKFEQMLSLAGRAETEISLTGLPKRYWVGARFTSDSGKRVPNSYRFSRVATRVTIERKASGWCLIQVSGATLYRDAGKSRLQVTKKQHDEAVRRFSEKLNVIRPTQPVEWCTPEWIFDALRA